MEVAKGVTDAQKAMIWQWFHDQGTPEFQACLAKATNYTGPGLGFDALLPPDKLKDYSSSAQNKKVQWLVNGQWRYEHAATIESRWNEFKLQ